MKQLLCLGDSITCADRFDSANNLGFGYVNQLASSLGTEWSVQNRGYDGFTVQRLLENLHQTPPAMHINTMTLLIGINDIALRFASNGFSTDSADIFCDFEKKYSLLLDCLMGYRPSQLLILEPFIFPQPREFLRWIPYVRQMSQIIHKLSAQYGLCYLPLLDDFLKLSEKYGCARYTTDGVHLTAEGHQIITDKLQMVFF